MLGDSNQQPLPIHFILPRPTTGPTLYLLDWWYYDLVLNGIWGRVRLCLLLLFICECDQFLKDGWMYLLIVFSSLVLGKSHIEWSRSVFIWQYGTHTRNHIFSICGKSQIMIDPDYVMISAITGVEHASLALEPKSVSIYSSLNLLCLMEWWLNYSFHTSSGFQLNG